MPSERHKKQNGEMYDPGEETLVEEKRRARNLTHEYNQTADGEIERREELLSELFGTVDESAHVNPPFECDYGYNIHVGENFYANYDCVILDACPVEVGSNVMLAPGVHIYTSTHPLPAQGRRIDDDYEEYAKPVTIGDDVWIGGQATINPGVTIGDRAVVASGAVLTEDVPADALVQGNPAEVVRKIDQDADYGPDSA
ncbi:sugar O-acetyltransferase [Halorhabdus amylolytica]|uniref:sugar O-acetyltransferase n=1 Tax=Halorhabdus amylolytica TaxID=2559573 RepID=UPI0010A9FEB6|nr:sugar O-acetyltransferase [Halorhabdus amylolytica]